MPCVISRIGSAIKNAGPNDWNEKQYARERARAHREYFACRSRFQFLWSKINREYFLLLAVRIAVSYSVADIRSVACCLRYDSSKHPITHLAASIPFHVILLYVHIFTYSSHKHTHAHPFAAVCRVACVCERVLFLSSIHAQTNDSRIQLNVTVRSFCVSFTRFVRSFGPSVRLAVYCVIHSMSMLSHAHIHTHSGNVYNLYNIQCLVARLFIQADTQPCAHSHTHIHSHRRIWAIWWNDKHEPWLMQPVNRTYWNIYRYTQYVYMHTQRLSIER